MFIDMVNVDQLAPILSFFGKLINYIQIGVPILLIVMLTIDIAKAVISQDDDIMAKTIRTVKNRVIACLMVFFVPTFVKLIFNSVSISIDLSQEEYNRIMESYETVINYDEINTIDDTKSSDITDGLAYNIKTKTSEEILEQNNIEFDFIDYSKIITFLLSNGSYGLMDNNYTISYDDKNYTYKDNFYFNYDDISIDSTNKDNDKVIVSATLNNSTVMNEKDKKNLSISYTFIKSNESYILESANITSLDNINSYTDTIISNEDSGKIVANSKFSTIKSDYYDYSKLNALTDGNIKSIYNKNANNVVMLNTYHTSGVINKATGFFISHGVIVTSWSYIQSSLMYGHTIIVHDVLGNSFKILGVVSINYENDIVLLKLNTDSNRKVVIGESKDYAKNDPVISILSKSGYKLTSVSGIISNNEESIVSLLPLSKNDAGSPLFDINGNVIGMNTSKIIDSTTSIASSISYLKNIQNELNKTSFKNIKYDSLDSLKKKYFYLDNNKEKVINTIDEKVWNKYKSIGKIEDNVLLDLVKASYYDGIISLRYENTTSNYISNMSYANDFINELLSEGYNNTMNTTKKKIYSKGLNNVVIMDEFNYLIIVIAKEDFR